MSVAIIRVLCCVVLFLAAPAQAQTVDSSKEQAPVVRLQSTVSGSQEQPRVMYIVPWQEPGAAEFDYVLDNQLVQEVFAPIDRDEFVRELNYRDRLGSGKTSATQRLTD